MLQIGRRLHSLKNMIGRFMLYFGTVVFHVTDICLFFSTLSYLIFQQINDIWFGAGYGLP